MFAMEVRPTHRGGAPDPAPHAWLQTRAIRRPLAATPADAAAPEADAVIQRKCSACEEDDKKHIQTKAAISSPGDPLEREADHIADSIVGSSAAAPVVSRSAISSVQRKDAPGEAEGVPSIVGEVLRSGGQPLGPAERAYFEPRLGVDLGGVRVHTDGRAASSAKAVSAHAYTVGNNVVFGAGRYAPGSAAGRHLLAHELTHVVQQGGAGAAIQRQADGGAPDGGTPDGGAPAPKSKCRMCGEWSQSMQTDCVNWCRMLRNKCGWPDVICDHNYDKCLKGCECEHKQRLADKCGPPNGPCPGKPDLSGCPKK